jgi:hypothetical protein
LGILAALAAGRLREQMAPWAIALAAGFFWWVALAPSVVGMAIFGVGLLALVGARLTRDYFRISP